MAFTELLSVSADLNKMNVRLNQEDILTVTKDTLGVNFMARCGQKSDLSGLCGIGYWVWSIST